MKSAPIELRALNYWRAEYSKTYLGLRYLVAGNSDDCISASELASRVAETERIAGYQQFRIFKGLAPGGEALHRVCYASSPLASLVESLVLTKLSTDSSFSMPNNIYSYRWPSTRGSGTLFEYYMLGYQRRQVDVMRALRSADGNVALVTDVSNFYPSVGRERALASFDRRLAESSLSKRDQVVSRWAVDAMLQATGKSGVPVGPPLAHFLAHLALERVDASMAELHGQNYFRYVDDMVIVCPRGQAAEVLKALQAQLAESGLRINDGKTEFIEAKAWQASVGEDAVVPRVRRDLSFSSLVLDLQTFLALHPQKEEGLQRALRAEGIGLPLGRLRRVGAYGRFRAILKTAALAGDSRVRSALLRSASGRIGPIVKRAVACSDFYRAQVLAIAEGTFSKPVSPKRWEIQRLRHVLNRSLYLVPPGDYDALRHAARDIPELAELRAVLAAIVDGDISRMLDFPGRACRALGELWRTQARSAQIAPELPSTPERRDAFEQLILGGVVSVDENLIDDFNDTEREEGVRFLQGDVATARRLKDLSYTDEIRSLQMGGNKPSPGQLLDSRWSDSEHITLDALALGGDRYAS